MAENVIVHAQEQSNIFVEYITDHRKCCIYLFNNGSTTFILDRTDQLQ